MAETEQRLAEIEARAKAVADYPTIVLATSEIDRAYLLTTLRAAEAQVLALSDEVERLRREVADIAMAGADSERCATAAESEAQALRERMGEIERRAVTVCNEQHANADEHAARQAYALVLHDIAALSTMPKEKEG